MEKKAKKKDPRAKRAGRKSGHPFPLPSPLLSSLRSPNFFLQISRRFSEIKSRVYGKRQIQVENFLEWKTSRQKLSRTVLMDKTGVKLLTFE